MAAKSKPNEISITRVYDAPVKAVWAAWTDVEQVAQWWGPRGFTITTHSKDLRAGGHWNYTMHGPDGVDWPNKTTYLEVEECKRLVYDHGANDTQPALFQVTVNFSEQNGKTLMDMTMALKTPEEAAETRKFIKKAGGNSTWDRLAEYLGKKIEGKEQFVINRSFIAPINVMFEMWTNPKHISKWLAPIGLNMEYLRADIKTGGSSIAKMSDGGAFKMFSKINYLEIRKPNRIVYTQQFCDENENISRHPGAPVWPETMITTITLSEEGANETRVTVLWEIHGAYSKEELACFIAERGGMTGGWTGSFDKLDDYLASL